MKIALLICGTVRNYKKNYQSWYKHLLSLFKVDIFFHTYDVYGFHNKNDNNNMNVYDNINLINILKPKNYIIDSYENKLKYFKNQVKTQCMRNGSPKPEYIRSQLYSIYMANQLKLIYETENNFKYNIVIKIRFDTIFYSNFNMTDINLIQKYKNVILCGNSNIKTMLYKNACCNCIKKFNDKKFEKCELHTNISDIVLMSTSNIMDFYANIYFEYNTFLDQYQKNVKEKYSDMELKKYIKYTYDNLAIIYYNVPKIEYLYPEKVLSLHLKNYILLNYTMNLDINRIIF